KASLESQRLRGGGTSEPRLSCLSTIASVTDAPGLYITVPPAPASYLSTPGSASRKAPSQAPAPFAAFPSRAERLSRRTLPAPTMGDGRPARLSRRSPAP